MASSRGAWVLVVAAVAVACGGSTASVSGSDSGVIGDDFAGDAAADSASDGSNSDGSTGDGGTSDGGASPACPASPPTSGASCPISGAQCEYGSDPNEACNALYICTGGRWTQPPRGGCPPPGATCPASYGAVPVGMKCTPEFLGCEYPQGTCECTRNGPGPTRLEPAWSCTPTPQGCSSPRPRIGSACSQPGLSCNYGACSGGVAIVCKNGYWQPENVPCPL